MYAGKEIWSVEPEIKIRLGPKHLGVLSEVRGQWNKRILGAGEGSAYCA